MRIHFIQAGDGPVRIVACHNIDKEMSKMREMNHEPLRLLGTASGSLQELKEALLSHLLHGSWYRASEEVLGHVGGVVGSCKKPSREELERFLTDKHGGAEFYGVSVRTIHNWMKGYGMDCVLPNHGPNKLKGKEGEIRGKHQAGKTVQELADLYGVTCSSISRVLNQITYRSPRSETAEIGVVYNVNSLSKT